MRDPYQDARQQMVENQIVKRGVTDSRVIAAMLKVPRHKFLGSTMRNRAYNDSPLPIEADQTISQPYMVALMTELLDLTGNEKALEIGTGSGYQAAVLAELARKVFTIERVPILAQKARETLEKLGYQNIVVTSGDGTLGWSEFAPFDRIIITAAAPRIPTPVFNQLAEGGKLVIPLGDRLSQVLKVVQKQGEKAIIVDSVNCVFVPLVGKEGWDS